MPPTLPDAVTAHLEELIALRRRIHAHPEPSWEEHETTELILTRLQVAGLEPAVAPTGTGVICDIVGANPGGPTVALRADIDALRMDDEKHVPYRSQVEGVCHACGHDVHTVIVLGAGLVLAEALREQDAPPGRVRLIFQPAEEDIPGGASALVERGVLDGVDRIFALHCDPGLQVGKVGVKSGAITSAADRVEIRLHGPGGHTARPHLTADLVHVAGRVITELPAGLARLTDVRGGAQLVFGNVHAGGAANVIPTTATIRGTMRAMGRATWDAAPALLERLLDALVPAFGATYELDYQRGSPPVENDPAATEILAAAARRVLGADRVVPTQQSTGGEDFSWFLEKVPGSYARLGVRSPEATRALDIHAGTFDVDERAIGVGVALLVETARSALRG